MPITIYQSVSNSKPHGTSNGFSVSTDWMQNNASCPSIKSCGILQHTQHRIADTVCDGPLARYVKLRFAFSLPPWVSDPDIHHGTCVTNVPWCMPGSLISGFRWSRWRGKRSRHSQHMRNPQIYVSGKRSMGWLSWPQRLIYGLLVCKAGIWFFL